MSTLSEQQQLLALKRQGPQGPHDVYKAAIAMANTGQRHRDEAHLSLHEVTLLNVRRALFATDYSAAATLLESFKGIEGFLVADHYFLQGQVLHKRGAQAEAASLMFRAADVYQVAGEFYRELRARVNGHICIATLESCIMGELFFLEQEARRQGFMDIAANICRTRAIELLIAEQLTESHLQALQAADLYQLDGSPDDRSVALILGAIALQMNGEPERAIQLTAQCLVKGGKVTHYLAIFEALAQGKTPRVPAGHPLSAVRWQKAGLKSESVPGKIIQSLRTKPRSRDELISLVWGENAQDISYNARLHSAIKYLRKTKGIHVSFDGECYKLA